MENLLYTLPGIPVPLSSIICFVVAAAVLALFGDRIVFSIAAIVVIGAGLSFSLAADGDRVLTAALIFMSLVFILFSGHRRVARRQDSDNKSDDKSGNGGE